MQMNYKVIFVADGNATSTDADHNATLNNMVRLFADVMATEQLLGYLQIVIGRARGGRIDIASESLAGGAPSPDGLLSTSRRSGHVRSMERNAPAHHATAYNHCVAPLWRNHRRSHASTRVSLLT
jgi:hypothetical protein